jgi:hypothetical protein
MTRNKHLKRTRALPRFGGLLGWFIQGFGEFSLYVPALAWTAFTLLGVLQNNLCHFLARGVETETSFEKFQNECKQTKPQN